jgi:oxygen-independent coproporphyrinogen-3 oxidase
MVETMQQELALRKDYLTDNCLESIYFGGGTPSLLTLEELKQFFSTLHANFTLSENAEITLEANPDDITEENLANWRKVGINRLSIGLQSFKEKDLNWMNRAHSVQDALKCVELAKSHGFENISVDLIYGLPELTLEEWKQHITLVLGMHVQHISAYCLTIEDKTALHKMVATQKIFPAGEDAQSDQFLLLIELLKTAGFEQYEISNFGLPNFHAVHNSNYWKGKHYLGIGPSAHSFNGISRRWNVANNSRYIANFNTQKEWFEEEILTPKDRWNEILLTGLRTSSGVQFAQLLALQELPVQFQQKLIEFSANNWLLQTDSGIVLTEQGRLMADHIAAELFL